jgi:hypothetical protein
MDKKTPAKKGYYWHMDDGMECPVILHVSEYKGKWSADDGEYCFDISPNQGKWCRVPEPKD